MSNDDLAELKKWRDVFGHLGTPDEAGNAIYCAYDELEERLAVSRAAVTMLSASLTESQANDRTAMSYLNSVRTVVGGDDFPTMIQRLKDHYKTNPGKHNAEKEAAHNGLKPFALEMLRAGFEGGTLDGGDIQDMGLKHGLLFTEERTEPCSEVCSCAEYGFPSICNRIVPALLNPAHDSEASGLDPAAQDNGKLPTPEEQA